MHDVGDVTGFTIANRVGSTFLWWVDIIVVFY